MPRPRVLLAIHLDSFFTGLIHVARVLEASGRFEPLFLFAQRYPTVSRDIEVCRREGFTVLGEDMHPPADATATRRMTKRLLTQIAPDLPDRIYVGLHVSLPGQLRFLRSRLKSVKEILAAERISFVLLGGDIVHYDTSIYIRAAHEVGIPAVVIAGWMLHQNENAEAFYWDSRLFADRLPNRLLGLIAPRWRYRYKDRDMVRLPAGQAIARELLGIAPPRPWTLHSGFADRIAVDSQATYDACMREGLPADQVTITGAIVHDVLHGAAQDAPRKRRELGERLGFPDPDRPLILCALPPDEFRRPGGLPQCDFHSHEEVAAFYFQVLEETGWNVAVSIHPSQDRAVVASFERPTVKLATYPDFHTAELVPLCDLFICSGSSTIQWATACGKPIINYDVFRYRQNDYDGIEGIARTEQQSELRALLREATHGSLLEMLRAKQAASAPYWGNLDGHAGDRMMQMIEELIEARQRASA